MCRLDKKIALPIILSLVLASFVVFAYSLMQYSESYANLEQYEDIVIEEIPEIKDIVVGYNSYAVPHTSGFKSYMDYRMITSIDSMQYILQSDYAYTGNYGIRMVRDRYCIAVGSHFTSTIGQYIDLVLENGVIIPCILADQKADAHTDSDNIVTIHNGCMSEFVVDTDSLDNMAKICGNISYCKDEWQSRVVEVRVLDDNVFYE